MEHKVVDVGPAPGIVHILDHFVIYICIFTWFLAGQTFCVLWWVPECWGSCQLEYVIMSISLPSVMFTKTLILVLECYVEFWETKWLRNHVSPFSSFPYLFPASLPHPSLIIPCLYCLCLVMALSVFFPPYHIVYNWLAVGSECQKFCSLALIS